MCPGIVERGLALLMIATALHYNGDTGTRRSSRDVRSTGRLSGKSYFGLLWLLPLNNLLSSCDTKPPVRAHRCSFLNMTTFAKRSFDAANYLRYRPSEKHGLNSSNSIGNADVSLTTI